MNSSQILNMRPRKHSDIHVEGVPVLSIEYGKQGRCGPIFAERILQSELNVCDPIYTNVIPHAATEHQAEVILQAIQPVAATQAYE